MILIQKEVVERRKWMTDGDILDIIAIAESTPGPIAINAATFMGYKPLVFGAVCCTTGVVLPSFLMIAGHLPVLQALSATGWSNMPLPNRAGFWALICKASGVHVPGSVPESLLLFLRPGGLFGYGGVPGERAAGDFRIALPGRLFIRP